MCQFHRVGNLLLRCLHLCCETRSSLHNIERHPPLDNSPLTRKAVQSRRRSGGNPAAAAAATTTANAQNKGKKETKRPRLDNNQAVSAGCWQQHKN